MKKNVFLTSAFLLFAISFLSFKASPEYPFTGIYGVTANDPSGIELKLNPDKTFTYRDFSNPRKKINSKGKWEFRNNRVYLMDDNSQFNYHNCWKFDKNGTVAKSRKGLCFYTLRKLK